MKPKHPPIPFGKAPYCAVKMKMFHENAIGGMTIDENTSVLRDGKPIPGLYACGDTTRGIMFAAIQPDAMAQGISPNFERPSSFLRTPRQQSPAM